MCGIAGILPFRKEIGPQAIQKMTEALKHRGPDATGYYCDEYIQLGHTRLSIIDLEHSADQPMWDCDKRYVIVFNGEIFNYQELRRKLSDYPFRTNSDTEVILAAYRKWGNDFVRHFNGMFAFAIWDTVEKELLLVRDRLGIRPFYVHIADNHLVFASEIRSILASGLVAPKLDKSAVQDMLSFQSVGHPVTIIEDIVQVEAGTIMRIKNGQVSKHLYWNFFRREVDFDFADEKGVQKQVRNLLFRAVERRLVSDVPVAAFLSGGIDSSAVVGMMAEVGSTPPNTFTISMRESDFDESHYAELVAKKYNTKHNRVLLEPEYFLDALPEGLDRMDTPSGDGMNTYIVSKVVRRDGFKVALTGAGGDELFAGYPFFKRFTQFKRLGAALGGANWLRKPVAKVLQGITTTARAERIVGLVADTKSSIVNFYPQCRRILTPGLLRKLTRMDVYAESLISRKLRQYQTELEELPWLSQVSAADFMGYTQSTMMKDNDQCSMAVALELRQPFFDHELIEFMMAVPDKFKYPVYPKKLLVDALGDLIPHEVVHRPKQGFLFPWKYWMKKELRGFCEKYLERIGQRDFVNHTQLMLHWKKFLQGDTSVRWMEIWLFVILEYWLEKNGVE
jgi:asparagine synthase (glutamine-hydrolysing)